MGRAESAQDGRTLPPSSPGPVMGHTQTSLIGRGLPKLFAWRNMVKGSWGLDPFRASYCLVRKPRWQI